MNHRRSAIVVIVLLLILSAGCNSLPGDTPPSSPASGTSSISTTAEQPSTAQTTNPVIETTTTDSLPVNTSRVFTRTAELLGRNVMTPDRVVVRNFTFSNLTPTTPEPFPRLLGIVPDENMYEHATGTDGYAEPSSNRIYILVSERSTNAEIRNYLSHEYTHLVQNRIGATDRVNRQLLAANEQMTVQSVIEGAATFTESTYVQDYHSASPSRFEQLRDEYHRSGPVRKLTLAPYYFGARYIRQQIGSPADLNQVYANPPNSMEQVIHGDAPDEDPPKNLTVGFSIANGSERSWTDSRVKGEAFVRIALGTELSTERAARAANGWGTDRLLVSEQNNETSYAWALRWDNTTEAGEFRRAMAAYLDARGNRTDGTWRVGNSTFRLANASNETIVMLAGQPGFVSNAFISGVTENVTVSTNQTKPRATDQRTATVAKAGRAKDHGEW